MGFLPSGPEVFVLFLLLFLLLFYPLPSIIAVVRRKRNRVAIIALNLLLGWTLVGWVVALVWALLHDQPGPELAGR